MLARLAYTGPMRRWLDGWRLLGALNAGSMLLGCSATDLAPASAPADGIDAAQLGQVFASVAEPCPGMTATLAAPAGRDEIFVEAAIVDVPSELASRLSLADLPELAGTRSASLIATPHVIARFEAETSLALGQNADSSTPLALARWSALPHHVDDRTSTLELELELSAFERAGRAPLSETHRFSVTTRDNEPGLVHVVRRAGAPRALVVVFRSFRIHGEAELRAIFECKMQQRVRYLQRMSRPAVP